MQVKKILIFSRHGLRYPLTNNSDISNWLYEYKLGDLTDKGELFEYLFGKKLKKMLNIHDEENVLFISNSMRRTYLTAKILAQAIIPYKNSKINMKHQDFNKVDDRFNFLVKNKNIYTNEMTEKVDKRLKPVYDKMEEILSLEKGSISSDKTNILVEDDGFLVVNGAIRRATDICDSFLLQYYEGYSKDNIFKSDNFISDLKLMTTAKDEFLDLLFANDEFIDNSKVNICHLVGEELFNYDNKVTLIVGHDSNLSTLMKKFNVNYVYPNNISIEKYPVGAKLIFKIFDDNSYEIYYSYFKYEDIRNMNAENPVMILIKQGENIENIC